MPIHETDGKWQWGNHGAKYATRAGAEKQAAAAHANGFVGDEDPEENDALKKFLADYSDDPKPIAYTELGQDIRLAFDKDTTRSYDKDGRLHVDFTPISKANVCPYWGREIPDYEDLGLKPDKIYQMLRDPEEMEKGASTFDGLPILLHHKPVTAAMHDHSLTVGSTGTGTTFDGTYLKSPLNIWPDHAIEAIENNEQKELSAGYHYTADMTPGTYRGVHYDGIMRDIVGNHVALVKNGRAGDDVVVGDSAIIELKELLMTKPVLSRKAAMAQGALAVYLRPRLAQDAKIDLGSLLVGVSAKNFADKKVSIAEKIKSSGVIAKDADISDLTELLDSLQDSDVEEGVDADPDSGLPMNIEEMNAKKEDTPADAEGEGGGVHEKIKAFLAGKVGQTFTDADLGEIVNMIGSEAHADDEELSEEERKKKEAEMAAKDADMNELKKDMVTKPTMDAAIKAVETKFRDLRDAEEFVRPWVGKIAIACDTALDVYRAALGGLGVKVEEELPATALKHILSAQPKPDTSKKDAPIALDAKMVDSYHKLFPNAARLGSA